MLLSLALPQAGVPADEVWGGMITLPPPANDVAYHTAGPSNAGSHHDVEVPVTAKKKKKKRSKGGKAAAAAAAASLNGGSVPTSSRPFSFARPFAKGGKECSFCNRSLYGKNTVRILICGDIICCLGLEPFSRLSFEYCSMPCMTAHR